jgi:hypothetical protein
VALAHEEQDDSRKDTNLLELRILFVPLRVLRVDRFWFLSSLPGESEKG